MSKKHAMVTLKTRASSLFVCLIALTSLIHSTDAYSNRAGHCEEGDLSDKPYSGHGTSGMGQIGDGDGNYKAMFDSLTLDIATTTEVVRNQEYTVTLMVDTATGSPDDFRGFLFRLRQANRQPIAADTFFPDGNSNVQSQLFCPPGISAITHTNGSDKTSVDFKFLTDAPVGTDFVLEVTVMYRRATNNWYYSMFDLTVIDSPPATPMPSPGCIEDSSALIAGIVSVDGTTFGTCGLLASYPSFISSVCALDPKAEAEAFSPAVVCEVTCGTGPGPEDPSAKILALTLEGGSPKDNKGTCADLAALSPSIISFACNIDLSIWDNYVASDKCCDTCSV